MQKNDDYFSAGENATRSTSFLYVLIHTPWKIHCYIIFCVFKILPYMISKYWPIHVSGSDNTITPFRRSLFATTLLFMKTSLCLQINSNNLGGQVYKIYSYQNSKIINLWKTSGDFSPFNQILELNQIICSVFITEKKERTP